MASPAKVQTHDALPGMIEGVFVGPGQAIGGTPTRFRSAILPTPGADADTEFLCLDLVQIVAPPDDWAWVVLSEAGTYTWGHTIGLNLGEAWRFVTWRFGAARVYTVAYAPSLDPKDIARAYGLDAASAARPDQKAVQLRLVRES